MTRGPARLLAFLGLIAAPVLPACVDAHWQEGIRCAEESCPAALVCCAGRCLKSCNATVTATGGATGATASAGGAGGRRFFAMRAQAQTHRYERGTLRNPRAARSSK